MYQRESILEQLRPMIGQPTVKVLTGLRGCGKSEILNRLRKILLESGIPADHLISLDPEQLNATEISDGRRLLFYVRYRMSNPGLHFVFIDEFLAVEGWEDAVAELAADSRCDLYLASSGVGHLQTVLNRVLPDQYMEIRVRPFSFCECVEALEQLDPARACDLDGLAENYINDGGMPFRVAASESAAAQQAGRGLLYTILYQDAVLRHGIRDAALLGRILRFILANVGKTYAVKTIGDHLASIGQRASAETIANYLLALEQTGLVCKVPRFDIQTGTILKNNVKYFPADPGLLKSSRAGGSNLHGIVFAELERRGYLVATGRFRNQTVDFVAERDGRRLYLQILDRRNTPDSIREAARVFKKIPEPSGFLIITRDRAAVSSHDYCTCMSLVDFFMAASLGRR